MNELGIIEEQITESIGKFLLDLQVSRFVNEPQFEKIDGLSRELARYLKPERLVSKSVLNELYMFVKIVRAEAVHMKEGSSGAREKADAIEMTFDLILRGESHDDRRSGVPRV